MTSVAWEREAANVAHNMERQAARRWGALSATDRPLVPSYTVKGGTLNVSLDREGAHWSLNGQGIVRFEAVRLIAERMESRMG